MKPAHWEHLCNHAYTTGSERFWTPEREEELRKRMQGRRKGKLPGRADTAGAGEFSKMRKAKYYTILEALSYTGQDVYDLAETTSLAYEYVSIALTLFEKANGAARIAKTSARDNWVRGDDWLEAMVTFG